MLSLHLFLGRPRLLLPETSSLRDFAQMWLVSRLKQWPNHFSLLFSRKVSTGFTWASFLMSSFLMWSNLVFPLAHLNILISAEYSLLSSFFFTAQHSEPSVDSTVCIIAMCIIFGVPRLPIRPCDERPPAMYGHFCLVPRVSVHDRYYCNEIVHRKEQLANRIKTIPLQMFTFFKFTFAKRRIKCSTLFSRGKNMSYKHNATVTVGLSSATCTSYCPIAHYVCCFVVVSDVRSFTT